MHIDSIRLLHVARPLLQSEQFGHRELTSRESVFVQLRSGQHAAWGHADPGTAPGESCQWAAGVFLCLKQWLAPALVGQDIPSGQALQERMQHVVGNQAAKAALDIAWWHLEAARQAVSLAKLLGADKTALSAGIVIERHESPDELLPAIGRALDAGYQSIGLKFRPGQGVEMVRVVRSVYPTARLWIDCDGLCSLDQRETFFRIEDFLLERIEQPLAADDLVGHAMLQETLRTPLSLDQSITSVDRAEQALELGSCRQVRIDPERVGGITPALAIAAVCKSAGAQALAGVATTAHGLEVAQALATTAAFAGHVDVSAPVSATIAGPVDIQSGSLCPADVLSNATCAGQILDDRTI